MPILHIFGTKWTALLTMLPDHGFHLIMLEANFRRKKEKLSSGN